MSLTVRSARVSDKPALMAIAKKVWDGNDYLPVFFDKWVKEAGFWVGELKGRVIGCGKATHFGNGEWWLEGLRIDPDLQGKGLGTELSLGILARVLKEKPASLRLSTAEVNKDSITIIGHMGFEPILASRLYWGARDTAGEGHDPLLSSEPGSCPEPKHGCVLNRIARVSASAAVACLSAHEELWLKCGLLASTWKFREATPRYLVELEMRGCLFGVRKCGKLAGLLIAQPHLYDPRNLDIGFASGNDGVIAVFRRFIARRVHRNGGSGFAGMATGPAMRRAFLRLGMKPERGIGRVLVFEHPA